MANETKLALSAVWAAEGIRFPPSSEPASHSPRRLSLWTELPGGSHKGKPAGLGVVPGAQYTGRSEDLEELILFTYRLFYLFLPGSL